MKNIKISGSTMRGVDAGRLIRLNANGYNGNHLEKAFLTQFYTRKSQ
jgi:hypothetical protein